jgi:peptidoglycan/LPS O-acetylase OafA/YrhL
MATVDRGAIFAVQPPRPSSAFPETWPLRSLGRISYGCYVFHEFVHFYSIEAAVRKFGVVFETPDWIPAPIELLATVGLATVSWRFFERPIMAWVHRATQKAVPAAA